MLQPFVKKIDPDPCGCGGAVGRWGPAVGAGLRRIEAGWGRMVGTAAAAEANLIGRLTTRPGVHKVFEIATAIPGPSGAFSKAPPPPQGKSITCP